MLSSALIRVLTAGRPHFNSRVAEMRHWHVGFDTQAFAAFIGSGIDPVATAVEQIANGRTAQVVTVAYDIALNLVAQGLAGPGARLPWVNRVWERLAPCHARLLADHPKEVLGLLTNAAVNLSGVAGVRVDEWLMRMERWADDALDLPTLRSLGQIAAWRSGMAHFREAALSMAEVLPETVALGVFEAASGRGWSDVRADYLASPWWDETIGSIRNDGMEVGGFTGFGGPFPQPPELRADAAGFVMRSGERHARLVADAYGATFLPAPAEAFDGAAITPLPASVRLSGSRLQIGTRRIDLDLPGEDLALACNAHTLAVSSPYTHRLRLLPLAE